jgi:hypothetical protein
VLQASHERSFFDWPLAFPEVFASGGFDVVIRNPPFMGGMKIGGALSQVDGFSFGTLQGPGRPLCRFLSAGVQFTLW